MTIAASLIRTQVELVHAGNVVDSSNPLSVTFPSSQIDGNGYVLVSLGTGLNKADDAIRVYQIPNGLVDGSGNALTIVTKYGTASSSGVNNLVAAQGSTKQIYLLAYTLQTSGTVTAQFQDTAGSPVVMSPSWDLSTSGLIAVRDVAPPGQYLDLTTANKGLDLNLSGATSVKYGIRYVVI